MAWSALHRWVDGARSGDGRSGLPDGELRQADRGGAPQSGSTWAPAYVAYGGNNRSLMLRVPDAGRVEHRAVDGSANPYLASPVLLAAGLDGIGRGFDPGEQVTDD